MKLGSKHYIYVLKTAYTTDSCDLCGCLRFYLLTDGRRRPTIDKSLSNIVKLGHTSEQFRNTARKANQLTYLHSSHTKPNEWTDGSAGGVKAPMNKGQRLSIIHAGEIKFKCSTQSETNLTFTVSDNDVKYTLYCTLPSS
jgi:hypothetical protein